MKLVHITLLLCAISCTQSATIQRRSADIPVEVVYDEPYKTDLVDVGLRKLHEKSTSQVQTSVVVLDATSTVANVAEIEDSKLETVVEAKPVPTVATDVLVAPESEIVKEQSAASLAGLKNLEERPQLSIEQLRKIAPIDGQTKIVTPPETPGHQAEIFNTNQLSNHFKEDNVDVLYQQIQGIVLEGVGKIRLNIDKESDKIDSATKEKIHEKLNNTIDEFLESTKKGMILRGVNAIGVKQTATTPPENQNIIQQAIGNIQVAASNFIQNFQGTATQSDPAAPSTNPVINVISQVSSGIQQFANNFSNLGTGSGNTQSTILGDEAATPAPNPIQQFVQGGQQIIQNVQGFFNPGSGATAGSQGDEASNTNPIIQAIQGLNPFRPLVAPGTAADGVSPPAGGISGAFQQLQTNVQQFINPGATQAAGQSADTPSPAPGGGIFQQFQNLLPFNQTPKPAVAAAQGDTATSAPPQSISGVIQQVSSGVQQAGQNIASQFVPSTAASTDGAATNPIAGIVGTIQSNVPANLNPTAAIGAIQQSIAGATDQTTATPAPVSETPAPASASKSETIDDNKVTSD